jgi:uncharacterized MnhB-related membrane protein
MPTQEQRKSIQASKATKWWLALLGVVLFVITVAPDYPIQHVVLGAFIVVTIHLLMAVFRRNQAARAGWPGHPPRPSNRRTLILVMPLSVVGVVGIVVGGTSAWHAYFCALAIGSFTAMCCLFPSAAKKQGTVGPESSRT